MNFNLKVTSLICASLTAVSVTANEPRFLEVEDRQSQSKIAVYKQPNQMPYNQPRVRDFEPKDPDFSERPRFMSKSVSFSFPVNSNTVMDFSEKQAHSQSREYRMEVTGEQLRNGVALKTTAPGALVRISGVNNYHAVEPQNLDLVVANQKFAKGTAFDTLVDSRMMQKTGVGFQRGTTGFKVANHVGQGNFNLKTTQSLNDNDRFMVSVFEKNSDLELHLTADKSIYHKGGLMKLNANAWAFGKKQSINTVKGHLIAPSGDKIAVKFNKNGELQLPLNMATNQVPGALWTLEAEAETLLNGVSVPRIAKIAFAYAEKTAALRSYNVHVIDSGSKLSAMIPLQANKEGRYEVRAVLYGTNSKGVLVPAMVTHSASDMAAGMGLINMNFDQNLLTQSGLSAPFELRNVQLRDQRQMAVLELR